MHTIETHFMSDFFWCDIDIFINCNWVVTRWQYTFTHKQYIEQHNNRTTQITANVEERGTCPVFANFTLAFALQLRKNQGRTSVRVRKTSVKLRRTSVTVQYTYYENTHTLQNPHNHTQYKTHKYTHTHTHTHTLQTHTHTHTHYKTHTHTHTHTYYKTHTHTNTHTPTHYKTI
jgi:archaellin